MAEQSLSEKWATIYALVDPRITDYPFNIRYIGFTRTSLERRMGLHLSEARKSPRDYYKLRWLRRLLSKGILPKIIALDYTAMSQILQREIEVIALYKKIGCRLVNSTAGGEGILNLSAEARAKLSYKSRNRSEATRLKLSKALTGKRHPPEVLAKIAAKLRGQVRGPLTDSAKAKISLARMGNKHGLGHRHTPEQRAKMSIAKMGNTGRLGLPHTEETKRKLSAKHAGDKSSSAKLTWEQVRAIRAAYATGQVKQADLVRQYKINSATLCVLLQGKTWIEEAKEPQHGLLV